MKKCWIYRVHYCGCLEMRRSILRNDAAGADNALEKKAYLSEVCFSSDTWFFSVCTRQAGVVLTRTSAGDGRKCWSRAKVVLKVNQKL